mmetsp:Transcript_10725/g.19384  ORF Transcript_10725/g.19384 Transcript_10725/m.19384 type:complete len:261 (-) Transcript_10725:95-877(-)|eukprot:CAMPEP_0182446608 /NCGR_PEP_ID=MMETSP1172-20130603/4305_1 /TAXON_ID=708627 /ORGANISM="Timspurckia oligopyrenoides, Strain CCMP3278" /LENGTH=260 /DNA_ID=CAMNT_0024642559 /DNA_START=425 /DNA_END=1207 /DNA_ORIENTATION=-
MSNYLSECNANEDVKSDDNNVYEQSSTQFSTASHQIPAITQGEDVNDIELCRVLDILAVTHTQEESHDRASSSSDSLLGNTSLVDNTLRNAGLLDRYLTLIDSFVKQLPEARSTNQTNTIDQDSNELDVETDPQLSDSQEVLPDSMRLFEDEMVLVLNDENTAENIQSERIKVQGHQSSTPIGYNVNDDRAQVVEGVQDSPQTNQRLRLTPQQRARLEEIYREKQYISEQEKEDLAREFGCTALQVSTWFHNRRKRDPNK